MQHLPSSGFYAGLAVPSPSTGHRLQLRHGFSLSSQLPPLCPNVPLNQPIRLQPDLRSTGPASS